MSHNQIKVVGQKPNANGQITVALENISDVNYTAGSQIDNYVLTYDHTTTTWGAEEVPSLTPDVITKTGADTITAHDKNETTYLCNFSTPATLTLPSGTSAGSGYKFQIKRIGSANVTVALSSGTIDGQATYVLSNNYESVTIQSDGTNYYVI